MSHGVGGQESFGWLACCNRCRGGMCSSLILFCFLVLTLAGAVTILTVTSVTFTKIMGDLTSFFFIWMVIIFVMLALMNGRLSGNTLGV